MARRARTHTMKAGAAALVLAVVASACSGDDGGRDTADTTAGADAVDTTPAGTVGTTAPPTTAAVATSPAPQEGPSTWRVPQDFPTIQEAVDAAQPGDLVLIDEGTYNESVTVETDDLVIRGVDRNSVVLDGEYELDNGIRVVGADGVAVENLTAQNFRFNGFFWTGVDGYRGSYLTAVRNGDYGIYAFDSVNGLLEQSYGSGSPDAGFYVGQCDPCNVVLDGVVSEYNGLGYSGTNSSGNLSIVRSTFRFNRAGIVPNSGDGEKLAPQRENVIVGNLVYSNNQPDTPGIDAALLAMGNGILVAGGLDNMIERNRVWDHDIAGIALVPNADKNIYPSNGNEVRDNDVSGSRVADLGMTATPDGGNCFGGNVFTSSKPAQIEQAAPCDGAAPSAPFDADPLPLDQLIGRERPGAGDITSMPDAPVLDSMPDALTAPAVPARNLPPAVDVASIPLPDAPG
jgi:hypothetical protein